MSENSYDYKQEIVASRKGHLGSSDGAMMARIDKNGEVSPADRERLAIVKGLYEKQDITTDAMRYGDFIEMSIFNSLKSQDETWLSNMPITSIKHVRKNVTLMCHPDFIRKNDKQRKLQVYECKATSKNVEETLETYMAQIYIEYELSKEYATTLYGDKARVEMFLCHYDASGNIKDENSQFIFEPNRVTVKRVNIRRPPFNISNALNIIDKYLDTMTEYHREDVEFAYLPDVVQQRFKSVAECMTRMAELEEKVKKFKEDIYKLMSEKDIKSVKNDYFTLSRIDPTNVNKFDSKRFAAEHKTLYKKYLTKETKNGYAKLVLKKPKDDADKKEIIAADFAVIK